jgi:hypothetical protein
MRRALSFRGRRPDQQAMFIKPFSHMNLECAAVVFIAIATVLVLALSAIQVAVFGA